MNYLTIERAIRQRADWYRCPLIPECPVSYQGEPRAGWRGELWRPIETYLADYIQVSDARYATEFEVKLSRSDWHADLEKKKWGHLPPYIARFIYVVPEDLVLKGLPEWVPEIAGVWSISARQSAHYERGHLVVETKIVRQPKRIGKEKVPNKVFEHWMRAFYYRYWRQRIDLEGQKIQRIVSAGLAA